MIVHATLIAARRADLWRGVLIEGPSGAGKSDLAFRAQALGFRLVADDRTLLWTSGGGLFGRAPDALSGLLEVRGLGIVAEAALPFARIALVVRCAELAERLPDPQVVARLGLEVPVLDIRPLEASAPLKLLRALYHLGRGG
jgi:serine kinase of HPr protein (carbohydrate metabolism regulator)